MNREFNLAFQERRYLTRFILELRKLSTEYLSQVQLSPLGGLTHLIPFAMPTNQRQMASSSLLLEDHDPRRIELPDP